MSGAFANRGSDAAPVTSTWTDPGIPSITPPLGSTVCESRKLKNFIRLVSAVADPMILPSPSTSWDVPQLCFWKAMRGLSEESPTTLTSECIRAEAAGSFENSRWSPVKNRKVGSGNGSILSKSVITNRFPFLVQTKFGIKALIQKTIDSRPDVLGPGDGGVGDDPASRFFSRIVCSFGSTWPSTLQWLACWKFKIAACSTVETTLSAIGAVSAPPAPP